MLKPYRTIYLSSFLLKIVGRLVDGNIKNTALRDIKINSTCNGQYDYQPGKSTKATLDNLNRLLSKSIEDKEIAMIALA